MVCVPLAGSQRCSARVHNILFNLLTIKQQRVSLLGFPFFSQTLVTLDKSLFSFGLSNRRISAVFSCFDQSLILLAASIQRSQTILLLFTGSNNFPCKSSIVTSLLTYCTLLTWWVWWTLAGLPGPLAFGPTFKR